MKFILSINNTLKRIEKWLVVTFLSCMVFFTFLNVILRALYTHFQLQWANGILGRMDWTESFVRLLVLWITFLGASLLTDDNKHIKIDLMQALLPEKWLPVREALLSLVCVFISALMLKASFSYIRMEMEYGGSLFLGLPVWIGQIILPAGFSIILFRFLLRGFEQVLQIMRPTHEVKS